MTVKELKAVLTEAGIEFDPKASKAELEALLPVQESIEEPSEPTLVGTLIAGKRVVSERTVEINGIEHTEVSLEDRTTQLI